MKLTVAVLLLTGAYASKKAFLRRADITSRSLAIAGCPGEEDFSVTFEKHCEYDNLADKVYSTKSSSCTATKDQLMINLLGVGNLDAAKAKVTDLCRTAYDNTEESFAFSDITKKGTQFDNEYYSGGTYLNYEIQTDDGENELKKDAARIGRIYNDEAQTKVIDLPYYLNSFDPDQNECDINAAYCCWVQDRQAGDNNGNCNTPYESQCIDKDPGDNTNFCYTDHSRSSSSHVNGGMSIFVDNNKENIEGSVHCHGFAWAQDDTDVSAIYKGNNLFFVSLYDHMYQRGYVRNAPGAPMCGCSEHMPVVTRSDCTEIEAKETFTFDFSSGEFSGVLAQVRDLNFNSCRGANNRNNDLEAYYEKLVNQGKQTQENLDTLRENLVGTQNGKCRDAVYNFLASKGISRETESAVAGIEAMEKEDEVFDPDYVLEEATSTQQMGGAEMPKVPGTSVLNEEPIKEEAPSKEQDTVMAEALPEEDDEVVEAFMIEEDETALSEEGGPCEINENCVTGNCLLSQVCGKAGKEESWDGNEKGNGDIGASISVMPEIPMKPEGDRNEKGNGRAEGSKNIWK